MCAPATAPSACSGWPPESAPPAPTARCRLPPHRRSATDGVPAPAAGNRSSGPQRYRNGARWSAGRSLPDTVFRSFPAPRRRRNAGSAPAREPRSVHPRAPGWGGMPAGRSGGPVYGLAACGLAFGVAPRMRCGLTLAGAQRGFQFPAQPLGFLFQPLDLFCRQLAVVFSCCARSRSRFGTNSMLSGCWSAAGRPTGFIQPYGSRNRPVCPAKSSGGRFQRALRLVNKYFDGYHTYNLR